MGKTVEYCKCRISSPSAHHDNCINEGCHKYIKTIYQKYEELQVKLDRVMESHNKSIELQLKIYEDIKTKKDKLQQAIDSFGQTDSEMKAKFIGEYSWNDELEAYGIDGMEDGEQYLEKRVVPWTLQKDIFRDMCEYVKTLKKDIS